MKHTRKMLYVCNGIFLFSWNFMNIEAAVPIDIVTEKVSGDVIIKPPQIIPMIPEKEPLIRRTQEPENKGEEEIEEEIEEETTTPLYIPNGQHLYLKYVESHYDEYYDMPFTTVRPDNYSVPGKRFGLRVLKGQVPTLLAGIYFPWFGNYFWNRKQRPGKHLNPPKFIYVPGQEDIYDHINFHFNTRKPY